MGYYVIEYEWLILRFIGGNMRGNFFSIGTTVG
jgi:hypothetical protein